MRSRKTRMLCQHARDILLYGAAVLYSSGVYAQINIHAAQGESAQKVMKSIEQQSGYHFVYDENDVKLPQTLKVELTNATLQQTLDATFAKAGITYRVVKKNILLKRTRNATTQLNSVSQHSADRVQQRQLKGKVTNEQGEVLAGATVRVEETGLTTKTGADGTFEIAAPSEGAMLHISFLGYESVEISGRTQLSDIVLKAVPAALDEIVVVGYGTQRKKDLTGAIAVVSSKALEDRPNVQFGDALEGKAAGVQVMKSSGQPQSGFSIRIRGTSSITSGSEPLYLVDGVPTASISEINPADIESFSILKDASSAAIYGASGANGVVLITTKKGKDGKSIVSLDSYYGFSNVIKKLPVLNATQYSDLISDMGESIDLDKYNANTNWQDELFRKGVSENVNLSVRGGNSNTTYYLSGGFVKQNGIVINNTMNRINFTTNLDHKISKVFQVGTNLSYNRWYDVNVSEGYRNSAVMNSLLGSPVLALRNANNTQFTVDPFYQDLDNPLGLVLGNDHDYVKNRFLGNLHLEANITKDLKAKTLFGYENYNGQAKSFVDPYQTTEGRSKKGIGNYSTDSHQYWMSENTLTYQKQFDQHNLSAMVGFIASKTIDDASSIATRNFANGNITTVNGGSIIDAATATTAKIATTSWISRVTYNYDSRYFLTANFRRDASTVFGPDHRWGNFPAFSAAWRLSEEPFLKDVASVDDLKLRASWGKVGNSQIPAYSYLGTIAPSGSYVFGGTIYPGYTPTSLDNKDLHWEGTKQTDIGLDLSMFDSRISVTADYYNKETVGLLLQTPIAASSGFTTALKNVGSLRNRGFEFAISSKNIKRENFTWDTDFNISINRNKVLSVGEGIIHDGAIESRENSVIVQEGLPLGSFYGYVAKGVDPDTGNMIYKMADESEGLQTSDMEVIGNANPKYTFGLTNALRYKNWNFSFFLQSVQGNDVLNATRIYTEGMWELRNQSTAVLGRWKAAGDLTNVPRPDYNNEDTPFANYNSQISSRFIEDGSYIRLKSTTLGYTFKPKNTKILSNIRLYFTAENLFTITNYSGFDPEVNAFGNSNTVLGVDFGSYPQTRNYIFGLNVTF